MGVRVKVRFWVTFVRSSAKRAVGRGLAGGRAGRIAFGHCGLHVGAFGFVANVLVKGIRHVLVDTDGSFRVLIVPINVLCDDITEVTFCFGYFVPIRPNDGIVVVYEAAAVLSKVNGL